MRKFDTKVQHLKYKVLREVARSAFNDTLLEDFAEIPKKIVPKNEPTMRCCIYKERAIVQERMKMAMGGNVANPNVIEVMTIACDECPVGGYEVTDACRGCIAHHCESVCRRGAISFDNLQKAHIDKTKCVECGACAKVCPLASLWGRTQIACISMVLIGFRAINTSLTMPPEPTMPSFISIILCNGRVFSLLYSRKMLPYSEHRQNYSIP